MIEYRPKLRKANKYHECATCKKDIPRGDFYMERQVDVRTYPERYALPIVQPIRHHLTCYDRTFQHAVDSAMRNALEEAGAVLTGGAVPTLTQEEGDT